MPLMRGMDPGNMGPYVALLKPAGHHRLQDARTLSIIMHVMGKVGPTRRGRRSLAGDHKNASLSPLAAAADEGNQTVMRLRLRQPVQVKFSFRFNLPAPQPLHGRTIEANGSLRHGRLMHRPWGRYKRLCTLGNSCLGRS